MLWITLIIIVLLAIGFLYLIWKTASSRKLSSAAASRIQSLLTKADRQPNAVLRILEYDKVLDQLLLELRFQGTTGEKLMKGGPRFSNQQALWKYHKLRNVLAHQAGAVADEKDAEGFRIAIHQAFKHVSR